MDFIQQNIVVLGVCGVVSLFALYYSWVHYGYVRRRRRFEERESLDGEEWFRDSSVTVRGNRSTAIRILEELASDLGVDWRKLRNDDTFEQAIVLPNRFSDGEDLESTRLFLEKLAEQWNVPASAFPPFSGRLDEFLHSLLTLAKRDP